MNKGISISLAIVCLAASCLSIIGCGGYEVVHTDLQPTNACENEVQDINETNVDCGGACEPCDVIEKPDLFDWTNCGQPSTFPDLACQVDTSGDELKYAVEIKSGETHLTVVIDPQDGHYREPEFRPRAWLTVIEANSGNEVVISEHIDMTTLPNYDRPHTLYLDVLSIAPNDTEHTVHVTGERGKYSMFGLVVRRPVPVAID